MRSIDDIRTTGAGWITEAEVEMICDRVKALEFALWELVSLERTQAPDMSGKRRAYAMMQNGKVLAEAIDRARDLLGYDYAPTDPHHGGKIWET